METREMSLEEQVFYAIRRAGLLHSREKRANVIEKRLIFTTAYNANEIEEALEGIEVSLSAENFSGFCGGILFSIHPKRYRQLKHNLKV